VRAFLGEAQRHGAADSGRRSGDENRSTFQSPQFFSKGNNTASSLDTEVMAKLLFIPAFLLLAGAVIAGDSTAARVPVLLELFTSEGCSSCPPADALLAKFDREQPVAGADLIVLSEHVDYWNQLGWKDPFSSHLFSERQRDYAGFLNGDVYTPELVVDGARGLVGSDQREAVNAIREAVKRPKAAIRVAAERGESKAHITIHLDGGGNGSLYLALAHDSMKSQVLRGENGGRNLAHVAVVYSLEKIGKVEAGKASDFERSVEIRGNEPVRVVAFVANSGAGHITAIGYARL